MASRIVLITGANSGVGFAATKAIANASEAFHVIMACRSLEKAESALSEIKASGIKNTLSTVQLDVTDENSIQQAVNHVQDKFGRLDALVNNAGVAGVGAADTRARFRLCNEVNVVGPSMMSRAFRPLLLKSENPYSIFISSRVGSLTLAADPNSPTYRGPKGGEPYRASKAALNMVILQELVELESTPLKIFAVCPGFVRSNLRGTSEEARSGWGRAGDPVVPAQTILSVIQGKRDADVGKLVSHEGVSPW